MFFRRVALAIARDVHTHIRGFHARVDGQNILHPQHPIQRVKHVMLHVLERIHEGRIGDGGRRLDRRRVVEHGLLRVAFRPDRQSRYEVGILPGAIREQLDEASDELVRGRPVEAPTQRAEDLPLHVVDLLVGVQALADGLADEAGLDLRPRPALERDDEARDVGQLELAAARQRPPRPRRPRAQIAVEVGHGDAGCLAGEGAGLDDVVRPGAHLAPVGRGDRRPGEGQVVAASVVRDFLVQHDSQLFDEVGVVGPGIWPRHLFSFNHVLCLLDGGSVGQEIENYGDEAGARVDNNTYVERGGSDLGQMSEIRSIMILYVCHEMITFSIGPLVLLSSVEFLPRFLSAWCANVYR